jgi:RimJ/RimL family protein N-acetyltransferase
MTTWTRTSPPPVEGTTTIIKTARLVLRAPRTEDAAEITTIANDRRIAENTARIPHPYTLADAHGFIAYINGSEREIAFVVTLPSGQIMGTCGIGSLDGKSIEIGYWLGVPYWGKGYATEAARAVVNHAFTALRHDTLEAGARVSNPASRRVLEKCGFQWTGVALRRSRAIGSHVPVDRFRLVRSIWATARSHGEAEQVS